MTDRTVLAALIACALGAGAVLVFSLWPSPNNTTFPKGLDYLCPNGHEFSLTVDQLDQFFRQHYGEPVPCPVCSAKPAQRAERDFKTGRLHAWSRNEGLEPTPGQKALPKE